MGPLTLSPVNPILQLGGMNVQRTAAAQDNTFTFVDVQPGAYFVSGVGMGAAGRSSIIVLPEANEQAVLALQPTVALTGRVEFRGGRQPSMAELSGTQVRLVPEQQSPGSPLYLARIRATGEFTIQNIQKGRYKLLVTPAPPWSQAAGLIGGVDTMFVAVDVTDNVTGAVVALAIKR